MQFYATLRYYIASKERIAVNKKIIRRIAGAVAVAALLAAGYAGAHFLPTTHAASNTQNGHQVVWDCPSIGTHC